MNFFKDLKNSVYNPAFYRQLLDRSFGYSFSYYAKLAAVIALVWSASISFALVPAAYSFFNQASQAVGEVYPADLELAVKDGVLTKNIAGPVRLPLPAIVKEKMTSENQATTTKALAVIDTEASADLASYEKAGAYVLVTKEALVYQDGEDKTRVSIAPFDHQMTFGLNQAKIIDHIEKARPWLKLVAPALLVVLFLAFMFVMYLMLLPLGLLALLVWGVLRLMKKNIGRTVAFGTAYRLTLHASTASFLVWAIFSVLVGSGFGVLFFSGLTLFLVYLNLRVVEPVVVA